MKLNKVNVFGWIYVILLGICNFFFKEELSIITTGLGGLICLIIGLILVLYEGKKVG